MAGDPFPTAPSERLAATGWVLDERTSETLFALSDLRVEGHTVLYERPDLREAVREATGGAVDQPWRFFFATRLAFRPPLPPGIGSTSVFPTVLAESRRRFVADLEERGFEAVERGRTRWMRTDSGDRVRLTKYTARFEAGDLAAGVEAWFGVWAHEPEFRAAGGAYPTSGLPVDLDPSAYREELISLLRSVE